MTEVNGGATVATETGTISETAPSTVEEKQPTEVRKTDDEVWDFITSREEKKEVEEIPEAKVEEIDFNGHTIRTCKLGDVQYWSMKDVCEAVNIPFAGYSKIEPHKSINMPTKKLEPNRCVDQEGLKKLLTSIAKKADKGTATSLARQLLNL